MTYIGSDLKFRITTTKGDFTLAGCPFCIVIKNSFGNSLEQKASLQQILAAKVTATSGVQYTVEQLLAAMADLMESTIVVNRP